MPINKAVLHVLEQIERSLRIKLRPPPLSEHEFVAGLDRHYPDLPAARRAALIQEFAAMQRLGPLRKERAAAALEDMRSGASRDPRAQAIIEILDILGPPPENPGAVPLVGGFRERVARNRQEKDREKWQDKLRERSKAMARARYKARKERQLAELNNLQSAG
jgi:hypothetical protein